MNMNNEYRSASQKDPIRASIVIIIITILYTRMIDVTHFGIT